MSMMKFRSLEAYDVKLQSRSIEPALVKDPVGQGGDAFNWQIVSSDVIVLA